MDDKQTQKFRDAVDEKNQAAAEASRVTAHEQQVNDTDESQDTASPRQKSSGHGKKTADKWNQ